MVFPNCHGPTCVLRREALPEVLVDTVSCESRLVLRLSSFEMADTRWLVVAARRGELGL